MVYLRILEQLLFGFLRTLYFSVIIVIFGVILGILGGVFITKKFNNQIIRFVLYRIYGILFSVPSFLLLFVFRHNSIFFNSSTELVGIFVLSIKLLVYVAITIERGISAIPLDQWRSAKSLGYNKIETYRYFILPQAIKYQLAPLLEKIAIIIQETSIFSAFGVLEVTKVGKNIATHYMSESITWFVWITVALFYCLIIYFLVKISQKCAHKYIN